MCNPAVALAFTAASGVVQGVADYQQTKAASAQASYAAQVAANNARTAEALAKDAEARGGEEERRARLQTQKQIGDTNAAVAAQGVQIGSAGIGTDLVGDTAFIGEKRAHDIRMQTAREAFGYRNESYNFLTESQLDKAKSKAYKKSAPILFAADLLGSTSTVLGQAYDFYGNPHKKKQ